MSEEIKCSYTQGSQRLYGGYCYAETSVKYDHHSMRYLQAVSQNHRAIIISASNYEEATGKAMLLARKLYPPEDGYHSHSADVVEVPASAILVMKVGIDTEKAPA